MHVAPFAHVGGLALLAAHDCMHSALHCRTGVRVRDARMPFFQGGRVRGCCYVSVQAHLLQCWRAHAALQCRARRRRTNRRRLHSTAADQHQASLHQQPQLAAVEAHSRSLLAAISPRHCGHQPARTRARSLLAAALMAQLRQLQAPALLRALGALSGSGGQQQQQMLVCLQQQVCQQQRSWLVSGRDLAVPCTNVAACRP